MGSSLWPGLLLGLTQGLGTAWSPRLAWGLSPGLRGLGLGLGMLGTLGRLHCFLSHLQEYTTGSTGHQHEYRQGHNMDVSLSR